ncbi:MAG: Calx-beta domain-containing protein [Alphaproteobacteria bacterium]
MLRFPTSKRRRRVGAECRSKGGIAVALLGCAVLLTSPISADADVLYLEGGGKLKGEIVQANGNIVIVQRRTGGIQQIVRKRIIEISVDLENGRALQGKFAGWSHGTLQLETDAGPIRVREGRILDGRDEPVETASLSDPSADLTAVSRGRAGQHSYLPPPIFVLGNGATIAGRPIDFQSPLLTVRRASGGQQTLRVDDLRDVVVRSVDGGSITGEFIDWSDGVFELRVEDRIVQVSRGVILNESADDVTAGGPREVLRAPADRTETAALAPEDGVASDAQGTGGPTPVDQDWIRISVTGAEASEQDEALHFGLHLSRPAPRDLIIIYTALAGTADRDDFTKGNGVLKIKAGSDEGEISIPLVDDEVREGDESLSLFLSSDPSLVQMSPNRITATIKDND